MQTAEEYSEEDARCGDYDVSTGKCKGTDQGCDCYASFDINMLLDK